MPTLKSSMKVTKAVLGFQQRATPAMINCHSLFSLSPHSGYQRNERNSVVTFSESVILVYPEVYQVAQATRS